MVESSHGMSADGLGPAILFCRRRRYYVAIMACLGYLVSYSTRVNLSVAIIYMTQVKNVTLSNGTKVSTKEFHWDEETQGWLLASFFYGYIVTQIPGGYLAGVIGGNHVLNIGVAGSGLLSFLGPISVKVGVATGIAMRILCGLFQGMTVPAANSLWARWAPPLERTILSTIAISGNFFSSFIIMPICGSVSQYLGWEWTFYLSGAVSLLWSMIWGFTVWAGPEKDKFIKPSELEYIQKSIGERTDKRPFHPWKKILSSLPVGAIVVSQTGHNWGYYTVLLYGPKYYHETLHYNVTEATIFTGLSFTITGLLMQIFGHISDSLRKKGLKTVTVRKMFCGGGFLLQTLFMLLLAFFTQKVWCVVFSILTIGLGGITWSGFNVNPLDIAAPHSAVISGIANTCATFSGIFSPTVVSLFLPSNKQKLEDWIWIWIICAAVYLVCSLFFLLFAKGEKQSWVYTPEVTPEVHTPKVTSGVYTPKEE